MKTRLFILIMTIVAATAQAQYKPLSDFSGDTLKYIVHNFEKNSNTYRGYPLEKVINDFGLEIKEIVCGTDNERDYRLPQHVSRVAIYYLDYSTTSDYRQQNRPFMFVVAHVRPPYTINKNNVIKNENLRHPMDQALYLKDLIIDSVTVGRFPIVFPNQNIQKKHSEPTIQKRPVYNTIEEIEKSFIYTAPFD